VLRAAALPVVKVTTEDGKTLRLNRQKDIDALKPSEGEKLSLFSHGASSQRWETESN
jgi:hypothetical protein